MELNTPEALAELQISEQLYDELLHDLVDNIRSALAQLEPALRAHDFDRVATLAHMVKGSAASLRVQSVRAAAEALEARSRNNPHGTQLEKHMGELKDALEKLNAIIS